MDCYLYPCIKLANQRETERGREDSLEVANGEDGRTIALLPSMDRHRSI